MDRRFSRARALSLLAVAVTITGLLGACASTPAPAAEAPVAETTAPLDWATYPGRADTDPEEILAGPSSERIDAVSNTVLAGVETRLTTDFGLKWTDAEGLTGHLSQQSGNGYGGNSLLVTFKSTERISLSPANSKVEWTRITGLVNDLAFEKGLKFAQLTNIDPHGGTAPIAGSGATTPDQQWQWNVSATDASQWLTLTLVDVDRAATSGSITTTTGKAPDWNPRSITLTYGATTIAAADRPRFIQLLAPFDGIGRPTATYAQ
jgi:hypothetical protein